MGLAAALGAGLAASLLSGSPAQAVPFTGSAPPAVDCLGQAGSSIFNTGFACIIGDKVYSSFVNLSTGTRQTALQNAGYSFTNNDPNFSISIIPQLGTNFVPGIYSFSYSMTVFDALASGERISAISTSALSSAQGTGNPRYTQTLEATPTSVSSGPLGAVKVASETRSATTTTNSGNIDFDTPVISADFVSTLAVATGGSNGNFVSNINSSVIQLKGPPTGDTVPGPLPILGAGAAFGLSRKLRRRISQTT